MTVENGVFEICYLTIKRKKIKTHTLHLNFIFRNNNATKIKEKATTKKILSKRFSLQKDKTTL